MEILRGWGFLDSGAWLFVVLAQVVQKIDNVIISVHWIVNTYPLDSIIQSFNNWHLMSLTF